MVPITIRPCPIRRQHAVRLTLRAFTLIELLICMSIMGILTAVAVPRYEQYRRRAFDLRAESDLRNVAVAQESWFLEHEEYLPCTDQECAQLPGIAALSAGTKLTVKVEQGEFIAEAQHPSGTGKVYRWESSNGGAASGAPEG